MSKFKRCSWNPEQYCGLTLDESKMYDRLKDSEGELIDKLLEKLNNARWVDSPKI